MEGLRYKLYYSGENRIRSEPFILEFTQEFLLKRLLQSSLCLLTLYLLMCTNIGKSTPVAWHLRKNHWTIPCTEKRKMDDIKSNIIAGYRKIVNADMKWVRKILKCPFFSFFFSFHVSQHDAICCPSYFSSDVDHFLLFPHHHHHHKPSQKTTDWTGTCASPNGKKYV